MSVLTNYNGKMVVLGDQPIAGSRWATRPDMPVATYIHAGVVFKDKMWFIGGFYLKSLSSTKEVYSSPDGYTWTREGDLPDTVSSHKAIVYDNKIWVIGGTTGVVYSAKVWYSSDGKTWKEAGTNSFTGGIRNHTSFVLDNKMWVVGGKTGPSGAYNRKCMYSTDGINWSEAGTDAYPIDTYCLVSIVKGNTVYCISGVNNDGDLTDVYSSTDCINWTKCADVPRAVEQSGITLYNDKIYVIGGHYSGYISSKVYYTDDATTWTEAGTDALTTGVYMGVALTFRNRIWHLGGYTYGKDLATVKCTW